MGDIRPVAPRAGAPVESFAFASAGECAEFLSHALKELVRAEPDASVALLARHPEQARLYYEALANAEVPNLRLVADQDFSFTAGIDVTDVRQSKGLEFDIVILLEVNETSYPADGRRPPPAARGDDARRAPALGHVHRRPLAPASGRPADSGPGERGSLRGLHRERWTLQGPRRLEEAVQGPDVLGPQPLESDPDARGVAGPLLHDPANVAGDLHRLGLGRQGESQLHGRADRQGVSESRYSPPSEMLRVWEVCFFPSYDHLDLQLTFVTGIDSPEVLCQDRPSSAVSETLWYDNLAPRIQPPVTTEISG